MIYETFTCSCGDGGIQYGFCFKDEPNHEDCVAPDIVIGTIYPTMDDPRPVMETNWRKWEWMAQAVVNAAPKEGS